MTRITIPEDHTYTSIDPGESIGWAAFDSKGDILIFGQFRWEDFLENIELLIPVGLEHCITEDYVNYAHKKQKNWTRNNTSKVIGKIELFCEMRKVPITLQPAMFYETGCAWGGFPSPKEMPHSISHQYAAAGHGVYWLQQNNIREPGRAMRNNDG